MWLSSSIFITLHLFLMLRFISKCSDRSKEVMLPALSENCDRPTNHPTDGQKGSWVSFTSFQQESMYILERCNLYMYVFPYFRYGNSSLSGFCFSGDHLIFYRMFRKHCVFSQFTATSSPLACIAVRTFKALNAIRVYSVIFCTTNSSRVLARETFEDSWKKHNI